MKILYLDQNFVSRIVKFRLGQKRHEDFGELYEVIKRSDLIVPFGPFHVKEVDGSYLLKSFQSLFEDLSLGYWHRSWRELLQQQIDEKECCAENFLTQEGSWEQLADIQIFKDATSWELVGSLKQRMENAKQQLLGCLQVEFSGDGLGDTAFIEVLSKLLAFRTLNPARQALPSDLLDMVMAATVRPYVEFIATDRFVCEALDRLKLGEGVFSGRKTDVKRLSATL